VNKFFFFKWLTWQLRYYRSISTKIFSIKLIICGKLGASTRTRFLKLQFGKSMIKNQTMGLKINYGYSNAETYTGTFGIHVWIYQHNLENQLKQFAMQKKKLKLLQSFVK